MKITAILSLLLTVGLLAVAPARADDDTVGSRPGVELGGFASYYHSEDALVIDHPWSGGGLIRYFFTSAIAAEGSAEYRRERFAGGTDADVYPLLVSLMYYLLPGKMVSPYVLGGGGWYISPVKGPGIDETQHRFGGHLGAGLEGYLTHQWSLDANWRYAWVQDISSHFNNLQPKDFSGNGWIVHAGINYHF